MTSEMAQHFRIWYKGCMMSKLKDVLERVDTWPEEAQQELAEIALEIEAGFRGGAYHATADEPQAIDDADGSGVAPRQQVEAAFRTFRRA
jgi:hypothetical protein